ncbi:hypothetical protein HQ447_03055 [bacterium]|nr:hypothetical protein [bacterium]
MGDSLHAVAYHLASDPKLPARRRAKDLIFDSSITDPYAAVLQCVREALEHTQG